MKWTFVALLWCFATAGFSQSILQVVDAESKEALVGVTISFENQGLSTDAKGQITLPELSTGPHTFTFSLLGYEALKRTFSFPISSTEPLIIELHEKEEELEEVTITTTRSSRSITDEPTRLEVIGGEELEEKVNMNASNISMVLRETPGIQVQQTSATSANMTFRIQGLEGRYTQLLQNGLPLYSGFSGGLSIMQIPPLDLKQVEIVKGSSSTLYGGGAIAGIVNLVTKEPTQERELTLLANGTTAGGLDLNGFYSQKFGKAGLTLYAARNSQAAYDPNKDGFSDIPKSERYTINPRFFYDFSSKTKLNLGVNFATEKRVGGDLSGIKGETGTFYTEENQSVRTSTQLKVEHQLSQQATIYYKNSLSWFDRELTLPSYAFKGQQMASFSEAGYTLTNEKFDWVAGLNLWTDHFKEKTPVQTQPLRNYSLTTLGGFVQNTWKASARFTLETGLRLDHQADYGTFLLPRISALFKVNDQVSSRLGGGLGYKSPTIFTEESEQRNFQSILPIVAEELKAERSFGANWDVNYRTTLADAIGLSFNHIFFYTRINDPAVLTSADASNATLRFRSAAGYVDTKGFETNLKLSYEDLSLYGFYTFTDTKRAYQQLNNAIPLTAKHRAGAVLMWEKEEKFRLGYEAYFTGSQQLESGAMTRSYWTMGFMAERSWERFSLYINFENFTDTRLSRWQPMYTGTRQAPSFVREIWAPTDGRIINGGIKLKL